MKAAQNIRLLQLILFAAIILSLSYATAEPLKIGENLPVIQGETLAGESLELPVASNEKITLLVFSFTKTGGSVGRKWAERFEKEFANDANVRCYSIMFLESVPRLFRGFVSSGIKKGIPKEKHSHLVRVYKNETVWKERLEVLTEDLAHLALLDNSGKIVWLGAGHFSEEKFDTLVEKTNQLQ